MHEPFRTKILEEPGKTREPTNEEYGQVKRMQSLIGAAWASHMGMARR